MKYKIERTSTEKADFRILEKKLDEELYEIYGEMQDNYSTFNNVEDLKTIIVYVGSKPAACGCLKLVDDESAEVKRVYVASDYRGKSVSKVVMKELEEWAIEDNIKTLILQTGSKQRPAINLYSSLGYSYIENFGPYVNDDNSVCMKKALIQKNV